MNKIPIFIVILSFMTTLKSQVVISGYVTDSLTEERLINVNIYNDQFGKGTISNAFGFYSLSFSAEDLSQIKVDSLFLQFSLIGYHPIVVSVPFDQDHNFNVRMQKGVSLDELMISSTSKEQLPGEISIPIDQLNAMPALLGEKDILRSFQLLPGIQGGKEGTAGLHIRGGSPDQNLILLDDIPLYSVNHIGGFVSVFNPDVIKSASLYKGAFPARYGGRLSSVIDVRMKEGNQSKLAGNVNVGIISSKVALEGPLFGDNTTFLLSARRSLFDIFTRGYQLLFQEGDYSAGYSLQDLNGKISHTFDEHNRVDLSYYQGKDQILIKQKNYSDRDRNPYKVSSQNDRKWGNQLVSMRWNHQYGPSLFSNVTLGYTQFFYRSDSEVNRIEKSTGQQAGTIRNYFHSDIDDFIGKIDLEYYRSGHSLRFGGGLTYHTFDPSANGFLRDNPDDLLDTVYQAPVKNALEWSGYLSDDFTILDRLSIHAGIHIGVFEVDGSMYPSLQPRVSMQYDFPIGIEVYGAYSRMTQYIHLLSSNHGGIPTDLWVPVTGEVPPQHSNQWSIGVTGKLKSIKGMDWSAEIFKKSMRGLIEFEEGASFYSGTPDWQDKVEKGGRGNVSGLEISLKKQWGFRTSGLLAYTLSRNRRTFEGLNGGRPFAYLYDRRHDFSITMSHRFNKRIELAGSWVFMTGNAVTLPESKHDLFVLEHSFKEGYKVTSGYTYDEVHIYSDRNGFRAPPYHRLDLSIRFHKDKKHGRRTWTFGLYNAYSHLNTFYLYFDQDAEGNRKLHSFTLFPVIPSVSYGFEF